MLSGTYSFGTINRGITNVASLFTLPSIGALYTDADNTTRIGFSKFLFAAYDFLKIGFPIYTDHFEESVNNNIGEQVLVAGVENSNSGLSAANAGILHKVADNIVPEPRRWSMHGYLGYASNNIFAFNTRRIPFNIGSFIDKFGRETLLSTIKEYVRFLANARKPFKFTTSEGETVPALIKDYKFSNKAENKNFIEVDLEIQEFRYLGVVESEGQYVGGNYNYGINKTANVLGRSVAKALFL
jgi:hypothetical protein